MTLILYVAKRSNCARFDSQTASMSALLALALALLAIIWRFVQSGRDKMRGM